MEHNGEMVSTVTYYLPVLLHAPHQVDCSSLILIARLGGASTPAT